MISLPLRSTHAGRLLTWIESIYVHKLDLLGLFDKPADGPLGGYANTFDFDASLLNRSNMCLSVACKNSNSDKMIATCRGQFS